LKPGGQVARNVPVLRPFHPQVHFVQDDDVGILEPLKLRRGSREFSGRLFRAIQLLPKSLGTRESGLDEFEIQPALDVPESCANDWPESSLRGAVGLNALGARAVLDNGRTKQMVETLR